MSNWETGPDDLMLGVSVGIILTFIIGYLLLPEGELTGVKTDKTTNTKYVEYNDSIYTLVPYKNIIKE